MTQATVNVGNNVVRNLNPNAQHFSSSDFNNGTVLAGSTTPSDDAYVDYVDHGTGSYQLRPHQPQLYSDIDQSSFYGEVDPSSIASLQHHQHTDSNFTVNDHPTMHDHQQSTILNPNHLQSRFYQTAMLDGEPAQTVEITAEQKRHKIRKQLDYYFSEKNMLHDEFLLSKMDHEDYVSISMIANFKLMRQLTDDLQLIIEVLKELPTVEVDAHEKNVRSTIVKTNRLAGKRCIIILRDVPFDATETEISDLFSNEQCPARAVACERVLGSGKSDCWYVTFNSEDEAQNAFLYLTRENVSIRDQKVLARMKARLRQIPSSVPSTNPSTPVSPSMQVTAVNGGATSPPPLPPPQPQQQLQQQQQTILSYPNPNFVPQQQQQQQQPTSSLPQYSSQLQQQQYTSQAHPSLYMQPTQNQTSMLGNLQSSTSNYRHPIHSSMHVTAQYSPANQPQHPTSIDHTSQLQHLRMAYPNYVTNIPYDRNSWASAAAAAHQQSVQNTPQTLSFTAAPQQGNMTSYPSSVHPQTQFVTTNHGIYPHSFVYMPAQSYSATEPYSTMPYNGGNKPKARMTRDHTIATKPRNSIRPTGVRSSRQEGLQMPNDHTNELLDYCQHSTPHSEGSSSPVSRVEATMNRPNDLIATVVSNTPLQHVQIYPPASIDTSASDNIEHYHSHPTDNVSYTNSHQIPQQTSLDTNTSQEQINESQNSSKYPNQSSYLTTTPVDNTKLNPNNYQPLEQRKIHSNVPEQLNSSSINDNQQQSNKKVTRPSTNEQQTSIPPLMSRENRSTQNSTRPSSSSSSSQQAGRSQQQQQQQSRQNSTNNHPNSATPLSVAIPKVPSVTFYNQTSSPQSPNSNQKNSQQQQQQQQQPNDNNGPRSYADMLKLKQTPLKQSESIKSTMSPPNESNDLSSSRAQSPAINAKIDSVSTSGIASSETNGPSSSSSSDLSPINPPESFNAPSSSSFINNDSNIARRNSSTSDHPQQQQQQQQQQQHSSSPSHQQYNNMRGRGGRGGNYRYSNERRPGSGNSLNRGGRGGAGGGGRRSMNNNAGANGPPPYQPRGSGGRGSGRFFDRPRGGGNYHNSNQTVHRFTGNTGNVEPQVPFTD